MCLGLEAISTMGTMKAQSVAVYFPVGAHQNISSPFHHCGKMHQSRESPGDRHPLKKRTSVGCFEQSSVPTYVAMLVWYGISSAEHEEQYHAKPERIYSSVSGRNTWHGLDLFRSEISQKRRTMCY